MLSGRVKSNFFFFFLVQINFLENSKGKDFL